MKESLKKEKIPKKNIADLKKQREEEIVRKNLQFLSTLTPEEKKKTILYMIKEY